MVRILQDLDSRICVLLQFVPQFCSSSESALSRSCLLNTIESGLLLKKILRNKYSSNVHLENKVSEDVCEQIRGFMSDSEEMIMLSCSMLNGEDEESVLDFKDLSRLLLRYASKHSFLVKIQNENEI